MECGSVGVERQHDDLDYFSFDRAASTGRKVRTVGPARLYIFGRAGSIELPIDSILLVGVVCPAICPGYLSNYLPGHLPGHLLGHLLGYLPGDSLVLLYAFSCIFKTFVLFARRLRETWYEERTNAALCYLPIELATAPPPGISSKKQDPEGEPCKPYLVPGTWYFVLFCFRRRG